MVLDVSSGTPVVSCWILFVSVCVTIVHLVSFMWLNLLRLAICILHQCCAGINKGLNYSRCFWFISRRRFAACRVLVTFWLTSQSKLARTPICFVGVFFFFGRSRRAEHGHLWNFIFREITEKVLTQSNPFLNWTNITGTSREELCTFLYVYKSQIVNIDFKK